MGTPKFREPPPGLEITTRRTGCGWYVPASRASRTCPQCWRSHPRSSCVTRPPTPDAPRLDSTRFNARPRFRGESTCSHNDSPSTAKTLSPMRADRPPHSTAALDGPTLTAHNEPASAGWLRSPRPTRATPDPSPHLTFSPSRHETSTPAGTTASADFCPVHPALTAETVATSGGNTRTDLPGKERSLSPYTRRDYVTALSMVTGFVVQCRLTQAAPPHYTDRIPRCRASPRASSRPRLTTTPLPPARGKHHLSPQGTITPKQSPMPGIHRHRTATRHATAKPASPPLQTITPIHLDWCRVPDGNRDGNVRERSSPSAHLGAARARIVTMSPRRVHRRRPR